MRTWTLLFLVAGCATAPPPPTIAPPPVAVDFEVHGDATSGATVANDNRAAAPAETAPATRNQPPEMKLKLGHYSSGRLGLGLVIDRTDEKIAKVRFDGTAQTIALVPQYFWHRTEYHKAENQKLVVFHNNGLVVLHMEGIGEDGAWLRRDGDADPL